MDEQRLAIPRDTALRIAGVSRWRADYWAATDVVRPSIDHRFSPRRRVRLYSFLDVMALSVAAELRKRGVSLQHVRQIVGRLQTRGYEKPLTQVAFATVGKQVYFQLSDGTWEGGLQSGQIVLHEVLDLSPIRRRIVDSVGRSRTQSGQVEKRRGAHGSTPVLAGTRIPVDTVRRYLKAGHSMADILNAYPDLTEADVEAVQHDIAV